MKKRYIVFNTVLVILSLFTFLCVSMVVVSLTNQRNMENEIKTYLNIAETNYDGTNIQVCADNLHSSNTKIRVTFIADDGVVLYDTSETSEENHLTRPEIQNLGTVYHRYSDTIEIKMFYVASHITKYADPVYLRIAMPETSITSMNNTLMFVGYGTIIGISVICGFVITKMSKKAVAPLNGEIEKLTAIVGEVPQYKGDDIERLSLQIDRAIIMIQEKIYSINAEKSKTEYILENISQGMTIINGNGDVILVNKMALNLFGREKDDVINKNYLYCNLDKNIIDAIEACQKEEQTINIDFEIEEKEFNISITTLDIKSLIKDDKHGVALFVYDITEERKVEKMKTDFFANASHELKSPLTTIIGYQQMIKEGIIIDPKEIEDATNNTIKEANRMNQIISEMLELSRLESGKSEEKSELSITKVCDEILQSYQVLLNKKKIKVIRNYDDFQTKISSNDLYHLLRNLIDNAIKYNVENGEIIISIDAENKTVCVEDSGIGIAEENLDRIFERFYRVDKAKSKESGGTGLGLAIVKHICLNNNITITCESKLKKGSKFIIKF